MLHKVKIGSEIMKKCINVTMLGETAYTLKDIESNESVKISKLRTDIKNEILIPSGKCSGAYYVIQSEMDKYLEVVKKQIQVSEEQLSDMKHTLGLNYKNKPYRNRFYCNKNDINWNDLVNKGLAKKGFEQENDRCYFGLSKLGVAFAFGRSISVEKYKEL
jgi:hypothetical protein